MAFSEDLTVFFDEDDFAVAATYNGATAVSVIFDRDYLRALGMASTSNPIALGKASDFPSGAIGKTLAIGSTTYTIRDRQPQDDGAVVLLELEG